MAALNDVTRRIDGEYFTVFDGDFDKSTARQLLEDWNFSVHRERGEFTLMRYEQKVFGVADGVVIEGELLFWDANVDYIVETIVDRKSDGPTGDAAPEFEAVMSNLDTSHLTTALFNEDLTDSYPKLDVRELPLQAVGQSVSVYMGDIKNATAILFENPADRYEDEIESVLGGTTNLGYQRFSEPSVETNGRIATIEEVRPAADAMSV